MKYAENGEYSKGWWLRLIKTHGAGGSRAILPESGKSAPQVRELISDLSSAGYVEIRGKIGTGFRPTFHLTSFGHRYLEEHRAELGPEQHAVPSTPEWKGGPMPGTKEFDAQADINKRPLNQVVDSAVTLGREIEKHQAKVSNSTPLTPPSSSELDSQQLAPTDHTNVLRREDSRQERIGNPSEMLVKPPVEPVDFVAIEKEKSKFAAQLRAAVNDLLFKNYADDLSVRELLEHVECNDG